MSFNMACCICFEDIENYISCSNIDCTSRICAICMTDYITHCKNELNVIPKCQGCNLEYLFPDINVSELSKETKDIYYNLFFIYIKNFLDNKIQEINMNETIINRMKKEKEEHMKKSFPASINHVVNIALKSKLQKVHNKNNKHKFRVGYNKKCPKVNCYSGILINQTCNMCDTVYCKTCDQIKETRHTCKKEDIDSVNYLDSLVRCPECFLPATKGWGCDVTTCSNCKTNFSFINGNRTISGNHVNDSITLKEDKEYKLSNSFNSLEHKNVLFQIEALLPPEFNFNKVVNIVKKTIEEKNKNLAIVAFTYYKWKLNEIQRKRFFKYYGLIKSESETETTFLNEILNKIKN